MRIKEILLEASLDEERKLKNTKWSSPQEIRDWLEANGFQRIGHGAYAEAWAKPSHNRIVRISVHPDKCWDAYIDWAMKLTRNPHVPRFYWVKSYRGMRKGKEQTFTVAVFERLRHLTPEDVRKTKDLVTLAEVFVGAAPVGKNAQAIEQAIAKRFHKEHAVTDPTDLDKAEKEIQRWLDENHMRSKFTHTLNMVHQISEKTGCHYDFHYDNVMVRPTDGSIVLIDPLADLDNITVSY